MTIFHVLALLTYVAVIAAIYWLGCALSNARIDDDDDDSDLDDEV